MIFKNWMARVDDILMTAYGVDHTELGEQNWYGWWKEGLSPAAAVDRAISNKD